MNSQSELAQQYQEILEQARSNVVGFRDLQYSERPVASWGYCNCNGLILLGIPKEPDEESIRGTYVVPHNGVVVTHYGNTKDQTPLTKLEIFGYLNRAISRFRGRDISDLVAAVIAGDENHFGLIMGFLERNRIQVHGKYCDGSSNDRSIEGGRYHKDLVVSPEHETAIISIENREYVELLSR